MSALENSLKQCIIELVKDIYLFWQLISVSMSSLKRRTSRKGSTLSQVLGGPFISCQACATYQL